jgi:hypothetical protein
MKFKNFFLFLWVIFALQGSNPDPECESGHGSGSTTLPPTVMVFQSPGGRKFVQFLAVFTALVVKRNLTREQLELPLLTKTLPRHKELRLIVLKNMVELDSRACSTAGIREFAELKVVIFFRISSVCC